MEGSTTPRDQIPGVYVEHVERLLTTLADHLRTAFEANRFLEEQTGLHNQAGGNNLTEALSHIGTLAENAQRLSFEEQRDQLTHLDDHLRRSMMEAFEVVVKARLGKLRALWSEYLRKASNLSRRGRIRGVKPQSELEVLRRKIAADVEAG